MRYRTSRYRTANCNLHPSCKANSIPSPFFNCNQCGFTSLSHTLCLALLFFNHGKYQSSKILHPDSGCGIPLVCLYTLNTRIEWKSPLIAHYYITFSQYPSISYDAKRRITYDALIDHRLRQRPFTAKVQIVKSNRCWDRSWRNGSVLNSW